jgi:hypothetical protein
MLKERPDLIRDQPNNVTFFFFFLFCKNFSLNCLSICVQMLLMCICIYKAMFAPGFIKANWVIHAGL